MHVRYAHSAAISIFTLGEKKKQLLHCLRVGTMETTLARRVSELGCFFFIIYNTARGLLKRYFIS